MFILQGTLCKNKLFFFSDNELFEGRTLGVGRNRLLTASLPRTEELFFFFFLDFNVSNEQKNVGYNIFKVNCFLKHLKGAFVNRNCLPARLRWWTRLVYMTNKNTGDKILCYFTEPTFYLLYWANILSCLNFICICAIFFADIGFRIKWYYGLLVHQCIFNNENSPCFGNLRTGEYHSKILFKNQLQCLINYFFCGGGGGGEWVI